MDQASNSDVDNATLGKGYTNTINMIRTRRISNINSIAMDIETNWPKNKIRNLTSPDHIKSNDLKISGILKAIKIQQNKSLVGSTPAYLKPLEDIGVGCDENKMPDDLDSQLDIIKYGEKVYNNMLNIDEHSYQISDETKAEILDKVSTYCKIYALDKRY